MRVLSFSGAPRDMGRAFGESCRDEVHLLYAARVKNALSQAKAYGGRDVSEADLLAVARASMEATEAYDPRGFDELRGIGEGADMPLERVLAMNGLTDFRDVLAWGGELEAFGGCSSFLVQRDASKDGRVWAGQTWDLATDNMPHVLCVHRKPDRGPQTWNLTLAGCLSLIGVNEAGVCMGTTNIRTENARPGVNYLNIIHCALSSTTLEAAIAAVDSAARAGAHYYYLADAKGRAVALETSPEHVGRVDVTSGHYVHCNHCLIEANRAIEADTPAASSHARQGRLSELLGAAPVDAAAMQNAMADTENGANAICRDDFNGISSNGAVVMSPEGPTMYACHGLPDRSEWIDVLAATSSAR